MKARAWRLDPMAAGAPLLYDGNVVRMPFWPSFRSPDRSQNHDPSTRIPSAHREARVFMAARKKAKISDKDEASALSFEAAIERLEGLVDRLEDGELELEESLAVFEQGVALSKQCASKLESAEAKVEQLVREGGKWLARPFEGAIEEQEFEES